VWCALLVTQFANGLELGTARRTDLGQSSTVLQAAAARDGHCPADMIYIVRPKGGPQKNLDLHYCIDQFEFPNKKGVKPAACLTKADAVSKCKSVGKRLCSEVEWVTACRGKRDTNFPYGPIEVAGRCNFKNKTKLYRGSPDLVNPNHSAVEIAKNCAHLDQSEPAGQAADCKTDEDVYDMEGNVFEFVETCTNGAHVSQMCVRGGFWTYCTKGTFDYLAAHKGTPSPFTCGWRTPGLAVPPCLIDNHAVGYRSYEWGVRCCKDDGAAPSAHAPPPPAAQPAPTANRGAVPAPQG